MTSIPRHALVTSVSDKTGYVTALRSRREIRKVKLDFRDDVNGGGFDRGCYLDSRTKGQLLARLAGNRRNQLKSAIDGDPVDRSFRLDGDDAPPQMISSAAA